MPHAKKTDRAEYNKRYREAHREEISASDKARRDRGGEGFRVRHRAQQKAYKIRNRELLSARRYALKLEAINAYGGPRCVCCGETLLEGLSLDHIDGKGAEFRRANRAFSSGESLYRWMKRNNWPPGYQVLCYTCNWAKGTGDHCPHQDKRA